LNEQAKELAPGYFGISETAAGQSVNVKYDYIHDNPGMSIKIAVDPKISPGAKPDAPAFADGLVMRLKKKIEKEVNAARDSGIDPIEKDIKESQQRIDQTRAELAKFRDQLRQKTGRIDVSATQLNEAALKIDDQRQDLELEKLGKQSRIKAIQDAVARLSTQVEQKVKDDPIAAELQKVVDAREAQVKYAQAKTKAGREFAQDLEDAIAQAAEAKAKLLERQRESAADAGGGQIDALNQELTTLNIDLAEIDAKLTALNQDRDGLQWALDHVDQLTHLSATLADEQKDLDSAKQNLRQTQERLNQTPPVTIQVVRSSNG
jgi:chromosome segregation ATPase